jgi:AcrR family transcriptional regulator
MAPRTREVLIDAATRLLDRGGVQAVTLREVGRQAGVSHNAPYKHFASKEALLAAVAARELARQRNTLAATITPTRSPESILRAAIHQYIAWALEHPARFKLVFGSWSTDSAELALAADAAHTILVGVVSEAQDAGALPGGDPVRLASLLRALAHGAADLASAGHLQPKGKGHASADQLVDDLLDYLREAAKRHNRWSADGTYARLVADAQAHADAAGDLDWLVSADSTIVRAHQHAAGARRDTTGETVDADGDTGGWTESQDRAA